MPGCGNEARFPTEGEESPQEDEDFLAGSSFYKRGERNRVRKILFLLLQVVAKLVMSPAQLNIIDTRSKFRLARDMIKEKSENCADSLSGQVSSY